MRFQCPFCRGIVAVENSDLGIDVQCGHCGEIVTVPYSRVATGSVVGDFIILEELGRGGMGVVYLTHQISLDRPAALKILADTYANNAEFVVGFIKEARAAAKLNHPHIVQAFAVGEDEGIFYFAMENVDGETMKSVLKREKIIPVDKAVQVIQQIAEALDYAWKEQRLIHRDIKPDNIMITKNGRAKLADLGLARVAGDLEDSEDDEVMGTPQYISPEHLTGAPMDIRSDIYSLGATLFHLVTGRFPFEGKTATEIARKHLEAKLPSPADINAKVPPAVCQIIAKMMEKNVKDRYQQAEDLVDDLRMVRRGKAPSVGGGGSKSGGKKTMRLNASRTGTFKKIPDSDKKTSTTGSFDKEQISPTATSTQVRTKGKDLKELREKEAKKKILILLAVSAVVILAVLGFVIWKGTQTGNGDKPAPPTVPTVKGPKSTIYSEEIMKVVAFAKNNKEKPDDILKRIEKFFYDFQRGPKEECDFIALDELNGIFIPLDEERIKTARAEARKKHLKTLEDNKLKLEEKAKKAAEAEKRRVEEARKREEERKRQAELAAQRREEEKRRKAEELERQKEYLADIESRKNTMRASFVTLVCDKKYKEATQIFDSAIKEPSVSRTRNSTEKSAAAKFSDWGKRMQKCVAEADKFEKRLQKEGKKLIGTQLEIGKGDFGKVVDVRKDNIVVELMTGKKETVKLSSLPRKQYARLVKKLAEENGNEKDAFYFLLAKGFFKDAGSLSPDNEWKNEVSLTAYGYIKMILEKGSSEEKKSIRNKYKRLSEYKKAREAVKD